MMKFSELLRYRWSRQNDNGMITCKTSQLTGKFMISYFYVNSFCQIRNERKISLIILVNVPTSLLKILCRRLVNTKRFLPGKNHITRSQANWGIIFPNKLGNKHWANCNSKQKMSQKVYSNFTLKLESADSRLLWLLVTRGEKILIGSEQMLPKSDWILNWQNVSEKT